VVQKVDGAGNDSDGTHRATNGKVKEAAIVASA
jgi:hypothetical protein